MSFAKQHGVVKNIKTFFASLFQSEQENASPEEQNQTRRETRATGEKNKPSSQGTASPKKTFSSVASGPSLGTDLEDMDQWFPSSREEDQEQDEPAETQEQKSAPDDDLMAGGIYALQEQEDGPYWLAKVIYVEEQVVHVICYAQRPNQLPA